MMPENEDDDVNPLTCIRQAKTLLARAYLITQNEQGQIEAEGLCIEARNLTNKAIQALQKR